MAHWLQPDLPDPIMTVKYFLLLSSLGLVLTAQAQDCSTPPSQPNMSLRDSDILLEQFPAGTKVTYTCTVGYMSAGGSPSIICNAGTWTDLMLKCERRPCGSAGEVLNGDVQYPQGTTLFGDTAKVVCNTGFRLVGRSELSCGAQGWMGRLPVCEVVACDPPSQIVGGSYGPEREAYEYRDVVRYTCQKDLTLSGASTLSCSEDGVFTPDPPTCTKVECEKPDIANAQRIGPYRQTYKYKETVRHDCNSGYKMMGEDTSVCEINGEWTPKLMTCEPNNCSKPVGGSDMSLKDKEIFSEIFPHGSNASFVCNDGYEPAGGSAVVKCTAGAWSSLMLRCNPKNCSKPVGGSDMSLDKAIVSEIFPHGTSATFVCNDGYEPQSGSAVIKCTTGDWSSLTLKCKPKNCSKPAGGANMSLKDRDSVPQVFPHDAIATFVCNTGYQSAEGSADIKCTTGAWSPLTLTCTKTHTGNGNNNGKNEKDDGGNTVGRDAGIAVAVIAVIIAAIIGGILYNKKKKQGFHKGNRENATTGGEGEPVQLA